MEVEGNVRSHRQVRYSSPSSRLLCRQTVAGAQDNTGYPQAGTETPDRHIQAYIG